MVYPSSHLKVAAIVSFSSEANNYSQFLQVVMLVFMPTSIFLFANVLNPGICGQ